MAMGFARICVNATKDDRVGHSCILISPFLASYCYQIQAVLCLGCSIQELDMVVLR